MKLNIVMIVLTMALISCLCVSCHSDSWAVFKSLENSFSVLMPGNPTHNKEKINNSSETGDQYILHASEISYSVYVSNINKVFLEQNGPEILLNLAIENMAFSTHSQVLNNMPVYIDSYTGRDVMMLTTSGKNIMRTRNYIIENRLYQVTILTDENKYSDSVYLNNINKFLDSFKVIEN
jgi:hypothetical protein